jgi:predicted acetyltransferase
MAVVEIKDYNAAELCTDLGIIGYAVMPGTRYKKEGKLVRQLILDVPSETQETDEMREKAKKVIRKHGGQLLL